MRLTWGAYIFDSDGTLHNAGTAIDGAGKLLRDLRLKGKPMLILSNTGEKTSSHVAAQLSLILDVAIEAHHVYTARDHMLKTMQADSDVDRFLTVGIHPTNAEVPNARRIHDVEFKPDDAPKACVAVFTDGEVPLYYESLTCAARWLSAGAKLYITSMDSTVACPGGHLRPGPGAFFRALLGALDGCASHPHVRCFGKGGDSTIGLAALKAIRAQGYVGSALRILMVGDRFDTDIRFGNSHSVASCLVESGCHTHDQHASLFPQDPAFLVARSVRDLCEEDICTVDVMRFLFNTVFAKVNWRTQPRRVRSVPTDLCHMGDDGESS